MRWVWILAVVSAQGAEPGYVNPAACRPCHTRIFDSYLKTGMGRSFTKAGAVPGLTEFFHAASERYYSVVERTDGHYVRRFQAGETNIIEKRIDYVVGSGNHSKTFLHRDP